MPPIHSRRWRPVRLLHGRRGRRLGAIERLEDRSLLAAFTVNSLLDTVDENPGDGMAQDAAGQTTLRAAVMEANARAGDDMIVLGLNTYALSLGGVDEDAAATGDLDVAANGRLIIMGAGANATTIDAAALDRVFHVLAFANLSLSDVTVRNGSVADDGGGILNSGTLAMTNSVVADNTADRGGGIFNSGTFTVSRSTLSGNSGTGGGVYNAGGTATLTDSTLSGNTSGAQSESIAGGIYNDAGTLVVHNSTVSGNTAGTVGGIFNNAALTITNSTVTANTANVPAGGPVNGSGGIANSPSRTVAIQNTIVAGNSVVGIGLADFNGVANSLGNNLIGDTTSSSGWTASDLQNVDPLLGPLADNGGPRQTHALLSGSPAIDAGSNADAPPTDQRGAPFVRIFNGTIDIGAYERQSISFVVDTAADENDGNYAAGDLSLREAILLTNSNPGGDSIQFAESLAPGLFGGGVIALSRGELSITSDLTINGLGADRLAVSGNNVSRVFNIATGTSVDIAALTIRNGRAAEGGAIRNDGALTIQNSTISDNTGTIGGGILNRGTLVITTSTISNNDAGDGMNGRGGGIANFGELTMENATVSGNTAAHLGGGIYNAETGTLSLVDSSVVANMATGFVLGIRGGGIYNLGATTITHSTVSGNSASPEGSSGGGIYNRSGTLSVINSTISGNSANQTGGIFNNAQLTIKHSTIAANSTNMFVGPPSEGSGGVTNSPSGTVTVYNTIIADNVAGTAGGTPDYFGAITSLGHNLIGDTAGSSGWVASDVQNVDPLLGPLADNGGPTRTHALLAGSPAIDAGNNESVPPTDQRGEPFVRIANGTIDVGAYERQSFSFVVDTTRDENDANYSRGNLSLREAITVTSSNPGRDIIQFAPTLAGSTITLTMRELLITSDLTLIGLGAARLAISGNDASRVLTIAAGATVDISELTIRDGRAFNGGGIFNAGSLTLINSTISGNSAVFGGGGGSEPQGGGIYNIGSLTITNSTVAENRAFGIPQIVTSGAGTGGGLYSHSGTVTITNSTFVGNVARGSGGIFNNFEMTIQSSTIAGNSGITDRPTSGSGPGGIGNGTSATLTVQNTIIAKNSAEGPLDFAGTVMSLGNNLIGTLEGTGWIQSDLRNVDPRLGPLGDHGGPTPTISLLLDSPAIDAGNNAGAPATDQRGVPRPLDGNDDGTAIVDIGAFERGIDFDVQGTAGDDVLLVRRDASGANVEVFSNATGEGQAIFSRLLTSVASLGFDAASGDDRLIIDMVNGNPIPIGGVQFVAEGNGTAGDQLTVRGQMNVEGTYRADATLTGTAVAMFDGRNVALSGVEMVDVTGLKSFSIVTPNADDTLTLSSSAAGTMQLAGTSGAVTLMAVNATNVGTFIVDAATNDGPTGNDSLIVTADGVVPGGFGFMQYRIGRGENTLSINSGTARIDATVETGGTLNTTLADEVQLITHRFRQSSLTIGAGSRATILPDGTDAATSVLDTLTVNDGGTLDLNDNALIVDYTGDRPVATIRDAIVSARGGVGVGQGTWTGTGITSSTAQQVNATEPDSRSVAYAENATLPLGPYTTFRGQSVDDTAVLIAYTRTGDANLDGLVNDDDVTIVGATYAPGVPQPHWALGDFDYNGFVDDDDVTLLGALYNPSAAPLGMPPLAMPQSAPPTVADDNSKPAAHARIAFFSALEEEHASGRERLRRPGAPSAAGRGGWYGVW